MSELPTSWESFLLLYLYLLYYYYFAYVAVKSVESYAGGVATAACQQRKPENCSRVLPGEGFLTRCYGPVHIVCGNCRHGNSWKSRKLHVSIAPVPRGPAHLHAALLLTQLGLLQICTPQFSPAHHRLTTLQTAPRRILYRMPPKNGPREDCGCCSDLENCDCSCSNLETCDCSCLHDIEDIDLAASATSSPPPPPPLKPPPTPAPSPSRFRHIICLTPADPMEDNTSSHWDRRASVPDRGDSPPPRPPKPPPRDMSRSPRRPRTRSRSRSPTPLVRAGRRHSRDNSREDSVTEAARRVVNRVWRHAERDRRALEEKWEHQSRKLIAKFQIGHKQGVIAAQRLHNSYVLPQNLSQTFLAGFLACLV